ncbi:hypothetical protein GDO78_005231 [Eleutherodactylus coqui]|uniref:Uncharacterized protein n=1 Tax=Eleutherodactylus coqui TaxID=57060 RepID=A0A8J6KHF1_ELECQ|nr:hypothetical protein GDO78_005231 [Eleutherodactylus coqui]
MTFHFILSVLNKYQLRGLSFSSTNIDCTRVKSRMLRRFIAPCIPLLYGSVNACTEVHVGVIWRPQQQGSDEAPARCGCFTSCRFSMTQNSAKRYCVVFFLNVVKNLKQNRS